MKKLLGIIAFLLVLYIFLLNAHERAGSLDNHLNLAERIGTFGVISIGAGILIVSGGIDLSIGSFGVQAANSFAMLLNKGFALPVAIGLVLLLGCGIGLLHGLLVTKLRVQAFVVTLCGLFAYRGIARWLAGDKPLALLDTYVTMKYEFLDEYGILYQLAYLDVLIVLGIIATIFLHFSAHGRYLVAIGNNERAALYSGIRVDRYKIFAYIQCSGLAACFGILYMFRLDQVQPSSAMSFFELYAIAAAVLGGCSLRGGEGLVLGMIIGTCILQLLENLVNMYRIPSELTSTVVGGALLLGVILDEQLRRKSDKPSIASVLFWRSVRFVGRWVGRR